MLERLVIRDLAVVERAEIHFRSGLNAVTGETGAGKSLVMAALHLLTGGRADLDVIREGAEATVVEGEFRLGAESARSVAELLESWGHESGAETLIVRREVQRTGRGRASVNQSPVTLAALKSLGSLLADLHGQHEHQSLLAPDAGASVLDRLSGLEEERARLEARLAAWQAAEASHRELEATLARFAERGDFLRHAVAELDESRLEPGEEESLARDASRLAHADRLRGWVQESLARLSEGDEAAVRGVAAARHALDLAAGFDASLSDTRPLLEEAEIAIGDVARTLERYLAELEADPQALEAIEARREAIARLKRKYRRPVHELIEWRVEIAREVAAGEDESAARTASLKRVEAAAATAREAGHALTKRRRAAARVWGPRLATELAPLGMPHAELSFEVGAPEVASDPSGPRPAARIESILGPVALQFTANPGEPARALARIASGGELSRVMLALKSVIESRDRVDLLFFDEVDSGIGGVVAQAVGERLSRLARHRQIVCVTHLPLIAALADHHLSVVKRVDAGRTLARIQPVEHEDRVAEIARMLAGDRVTDTTRKQARELLAHR